MSAEAPRESQSTGGRTGRVAAPPTQHRTKRLSPVQALGWLHLMPATAFPIRSREDLANKLSALLLERASPDAQAPGHGLPAAAQQDVRN